MYASTILMNGTDWQIIVNLLLDSGHKMETVKDEAGNMTIDITRDGNSFEQIFCREVDTALMK